MQQQENSFRSRSIPTTKVDASASGFSQLGDSLRAAGAKRIWVAAPSDTALRAYGFYRAVGWRPTGQWNVYGDEILELPAADAG